MFEQNSPYKKILASKRTKAIFFFSVVLLLSTMSIVIGETSFLLNKKIHNNVSVGNIDVGGLTVTEAAQKIAAVFHEKIQTSPLTAIFQDKKWNIDAENIALEIDSASLAQEAYSIGRSGGIISTIEETYQLASGKKVNLPFTVSYDKEKLYNILVKITSEIDREPKDAQIMVKGNNIEIIPHVTGLKADLTKTMADIAAGFSNKFVFSFNIEVNETIPQISTELLSNIDGLLSSYTTYFNPYDHNRTQNIIIAAQKINDTLIKSSEVFSFNNQVGLRLAKYGFLQAPGYINGELVPDWGGGVCQVSTTLYNTALLAGLAIEERLPHPRPTGYVPAGRDATVADNFIDFRFKNNLPNHIYLTSSVGGNRITINIYGKVLLDAPKIHIIAKYEKDLEYGTVIKPDPALPHGQKVIKEEGANGLVISTYRIKTINGKVMNQEFLATDEYPPVDRVELYGTKPVESPITTPPPKPKQTQKPRTP